MNQARSVPSPAASAGAAPLAARIAAAGTALRLDNLPTEVIDKVKLCLFDIIGCAFESRDLPWSRQALALATPVAAGANIIGAPIETTPEAAAFANAVMGHGLVREDMHSGSISHLGIVVLPTLLALAQTRKVSGRDLIAGTVLGYEVGGQIGRSLMDADIARIHRPTGITGPAAAAAAGGRMLGLDAPAMTSAIALGANTTVGLNQWAHTGGSEMFFHAGYAARNAVTAVRLAEQGAFASPSAFDGEAGLFAAFGKRAAADAVTLFQGEPEILAVYHKPVPACNFAQTPSQAALAIARETGIAPERIESITIRVPSAGARYPGCDYSGPFAHILQAKMSIQYNVAAALMLGDVTEVNFALLEDLQLKRLIAATRLEVDDEMTRAYPSLQGAGVEVRESGGAVHSRRLDDVVNASAAEVRARFRTATESVVGADRTSQIAIGIETLDRSDNAGQLAALLRG